MKVICTHCCFGELARMYGDGVYNCDHFQCVMCDSTFTDEECTNMRRDQEINPIEQKFQIKD